MIDITLSNGEAISFKTSPLRNFRGTRLPGCALHLAVRKDFTISIQQYNSALFSINYCAFDVMEEFRCVSKLPNSWLRLEMIISGHLIIKNEMRAEARLVPGQYQIAEGKQFQLRIPNPSSCAFMSISFSPQLFELLEQGPVIMPTEPKFVSPNMKELIFELLNNPYAENLLPLYYENKVRELLFYHLSTPTYNIPGSLSVSDIAAIYESDRIIAENLGDHFTINVLARKAGTNAYVLKRGFQQLFGVGVFGRLLQLRMDRAKMLLATTNMPIKEVCEEAGYETVAGFITAFRKRFGVTPKDWRKRQRSS
jgi:AraC-like DNA-binding protein